MSIRNRTRIGYPPARRAALLGLLACLGACARPGGMVGDALGTSGDDVPPGRLVASIPGFRDPESVTYDPEQDVYFVSNMVGFGSWHDGRGYIVKVAGDLSSSEVFAAGGVGGVQLDAPKGIALQGDRLWVADIETLRAFDRRSGKPLESIRLPAVLLNDVAAAPDGGVFTTDTGIEMTEVGVIHVGGDKVFSVSPDGQAKVVAAGASLQWPNGITWDAHRRSWVVVTFNPFVSEVYTLAPGSGARTRIASGAGRFDGVEPLADGTLLVSSWNDSSVHAFRTDGTDQRVVRGVVQPADIGYDSRRHRVAVPQVIYGRVDFYDLGR